MFGCQRLPVVGVGDPASPADQVGERDVGGVPAVTVGHDVRGGGFEGQRIDQGVEGDPAPAGGELRPPCDAVDVGGDLVVGATLEPLPRERRRPVLGGLDDERPFVQGDRRCGLGRQHREVERGVLPPRRQRRASRSRRPTNPRLTIAMVAESTRRRRARLYGEVWRNIDRGHSGGAWRSTRTTPSAGTPRRVRPRGDRGGEANQGVHVRGTEVQSQ